MYVGLSYNMVNISIHLNIQTRLFQSRSPQGKKLYSRKDRLCAFFQHRLISAFCLFCFVFFKSSIGCFWCCCLREKAIAALQRSAPAVPSVTQDPRFSFIGPQGQNCFPKALPALFTFSHECPVHLG